jgi:hypothetical protein
MDPLSRRLRGLKCDGIDLAVERRSFGEIRFIFMFIVDMEINEDMSS